MIDITQEIIQYKKIGGAKTIFNLEQEAIALKNKIHILKVVTFIDTFKETLKEPSLKGTDNFYLSFFRKGDFKNSYSITFRDANYNSLYVPTIQIYLEEKLSHLFIDNDFLQLGNNKYELPFNEESFDKLKTSMLNDEQMKMLVYSELNATLEAKSIYTSKKKI